MTSRSASGEGESLKAAMIHCSFGMTTSRARIATPPSQFTTMRIRSMTYAIGSAADDEAWLDMIHHLPISNINKLFIDNRQVRYWQSIKEPDFPRRVRRAECWGSCQNADRLTIDTYKRNKLSLDINGKIATDTKLRRFGWG